MIKIIIESDKSRVEFMANTAIDPWWCDHKRVNGPGDNAPLDDVLNLAQRWGLEL